jgi:hypothetical protein
MIKGRNINLEEILFFIVDLPFSTRHMFPAHTPLPTSPPPLFIKKKFKISNPFISTLE